jgi:hypothetical protein
MKKSELRSLIREEVRKILKEDTFESFKKDLDQVVKHAGVLSLKDDVITIYLDDEPNKEKNIINKLFREKYKDSLREIVSEPDVIKFKIVKKELNENKGLPKVGDKVSDSMNDEYEVIKITPNKIILKPLTFKGDNSIYPQDFASTSFGNPLMEEFWSFFDKIK